MKGESFVCLAIVVFFVFQAFVPLSANITNTTNTTESVSSAAINERNRITFVLGTEENLASLLNASMNATINATIEISIYNATEARVANFSDERVVFLASLDNETVVSINKTLNRSACVFAYNITTNISIVSVDDINITKYWVYGGDENIINMILYMNNTFYGGDTPVEPPKPPIDRKKIAFVFSERCAYKPWLEKAAEDIYISKNLNVSIITYISDEPETYENINLSGQDVIVLYMIGYPVQDAIKDTVLLAKEKGAFVITFSFTDLYNLSSVNASDPRYENISRYWKSGGAENMRRMLIFIGVRLCNISVSEFGVKEIPPPIEVPLFGLYHPDAKGEGAGIGGLGIFSSTDEYLAWYKSRGKYNESAPTIGIHYYYASGKYGSYGIIDALIREIEKKGANVIFATFTYKDPNSTSYFIKDNKSIVDSIITLTSFRLWYHNEDEGIEYLKELNVTPLKAIMSYYMNGSEWEKSNGLQPSEIAWQIALPELDGFTEFIYVGGKEKDPISDEYYYKPVDYQISWVAERAIAWAKLHRKSNAEKKIAIIYYNHGGGKDNLGASYLDIVPSLKNLLEAMRERGYNVGNISGLDKEKLLDMMLHQGVNIGTWAPGELKRMVSNYSVEFIPVKEYEKWFRELPEEKQEEVINKWGEPPGEIMVYENDTGKYFVIPGLRFGNVYLTPQPTRGWLQNNSILYHDKELPPHHQYIAFYFWLKKKFGADAIIHFGKHGTQEWLPGKETGLSSRDCWPAILIQDLPVVYPYIMDNVGEGTQAKRRGNAVIVDHLTPPIIHSGLYGNLSVLHEKIHIYLSPETEEAIKKKTRETITQLYEQLHLYEDLGVSVAEVKAMDDTEFEEFLKKELHEYLHELANEFIPYGLHILGSPPSDWKLIQFVRSMLGGEFAEHVREVYGEDISSEAHNRTILDELLEEVIFNNTSLEDAQERVLGRGNVSSNITTDLNIAKMYAENISRCDIEIPRVLDALNAKYIPPRVGGDPIRAPYALPTGNNFYSFDPRLIPTKEAWEVGKEMAESLLQQYKEKYGEYPRKVGFVLWATETMRHWGVMESEILYLVGVKPVWDSKGRVKDVELIPSSELKRPRIDVLITTSGLYRDTFPDKVRLLDKAIRLAAEAEDEEYANYVKEDSEAIYEWLLSEGYSEDEARSLSMARIFSASPGNYGTGLPDAIAASDTWGDEGKLADLYIRRMGFVYGEDNWGIPNADLFRMNLQHVKVVVHSQSSNLYGVLDNDDYFQYLGGLALAVRSVTGRTPELYVTNLRNPFNPKTETLASFLRRELRSRYFNPKWIQGMMEHDYAGAREMMKFVEYLWGWDVVTPDIITEDMWNQVYDVYIQDRYNLGLKDFFDGHNAYALQSIVARMLEVARKGYWSPSEEMRRELAEIYQEAVDKYGVTCCHHTCGNILLRDYIQGALSMPKQQPLHIQQPFFRGGGGGSHREVVEEIEEKGMGKAVTNMSEVAGVSKVGEEMKKPTEEMAKKEKRGRVMKEEKPIEKPTPSFPITGAPLAGIIAVIVLLVLIGIGLGLRRR